MWAGRRRVAPIQRASAPAVMGVGLVMQAPRQWFRAQRAAGKTDPAGRSRPGRGATRGSAAAGVHAQDSYAASPCEVMSRPSRSASSLTRRPNTSFATRKPTTDTTPIQPTVIPTPSAWMPT